MDDATRRQLLAGPIENFYLLCAAIVIRARRDVQRGKRADRQAAYSWLVEGGCALDAPTMRNEPAGRKPWITASTS